MIFSDSIFPQHSYENFRIWGVILFMYRYVDTLYFNKNNINYCNPFKTMLIQNVNIKILDYFTETHFCYVTDCIENHIFLSPIIQPASLRRTFCLSVALTVMFAIITFWQLLNFDSNDYWNMACSEISVTINSRTYKKCIYFFLIKTSIFNVYFRYTICVWAPLIISNLFINLKTSQYICTSCIYARDAWL